MASRLQERLIIDRSPTRHRPIVDAVSDSGVLKPENILASGIARRDLAQRSKLPGAKKMSSRLNNAFGFGIGARKTVALNVLLAVVISGAGKESQAVAAAITPQTLAWGHKHKNADENSSSSSTSTTSDTSPATSETSAGSGNLMRQPAAQSGTGVPSNTVPPSASSGPILVTPTSLIDLSTARFGKLTVNLQGGQFKSTAVASANLTATDLNIGQGSLKGVLGVFGVGWFDQFIFDSLTLNTSGDLHFDSTQLLQNKILQFSVPVEAGVSASVSQDSLNQFLADPRTLEKLSVTASKKLGVIASFFGASSTNIGVTLNEAQVALAKGNKIVISIKANVGMAGVAVPLAFDIDAVLGIKDGWVNVSDAHLTTNGQEISPQLSEMLVSKINNMAAWGHRSDDIQFNFTDIKVLPNKLFSVRGTAMVKRLRMSRAKEEGAVNPAGPSGQPVPPGSTGPAVPPGQPVPPGSTGPAVPPGSAAPSGSTTPSLPQLPEGTPSAPAVPATPGAAPPQGISPQLPNTPSTSNNGNGFTASPPATQTASPDSNPAPGTASPGKTRLTRPE